MVSHTEFVCFSEKKIISHLSVSYFIRNTLLEKIIDYSLFSGKNGNVIEERSDKFRDSVHRLIESLGPT